MHNRRKRSGYSRIGNIALLLGSGLLASCGNNASDAVKPLRLGVIVEATGPYASLGVAGRNGMQLAVEQANASGGINGRPIELLYRNDLTSPAAIEQAGHELIEAKVEAILGPMTSTTAGKLLPLVNDAGVVLMGGTTLSRLLAGHDDYFFRTTRHDNPDAKGIAAYFHQRLALQRISVIVEDSNPAYSEPWMLDFTRYLNQQGGELAPALHFTRSPQTDYPALAKQLLAQQPEAVLLVCSALDGAMLATQLRLIEPQLKLAGAIWAAEDVLLQLGGKSVEGLISVQAYQLNSTEPRFSAFRSAYEQRFKTTIDSPAAVGYDTANVLLRALRERKPSESVKQTLLRLRTFQGIQQPINLNGFGDIDTDTPVFLKEVRNGQFSELP